ncbi:TPA: hypothetical protein ACGV5I_002063 [Enterococcus faecium]
MKVYTKKDYDYRQTVLENIKNIEPLFQTDKVIVFNQPFSYRGRNYMSCMHDPENDILIVESFELKEIPEYDYQYSDEIMCPYCGDLQCDSWESDETGKEQCDICGGTFEYLREVTVSYCSTKLEYPQITLIE